jgi:hypothetical protein
MALATYSDLKTSIANYLARSDLTTQIPDFIRLAEIRLRRDLRIRQMLSLSSTTMTGGDSTVGLPPNFLEMRNLYLDTNPEQPLDYYSPSSFTRNTRTQESGRPLSYTILASEMQFSPVPDTNYLVYMLYYAAPTFLSDANQTNVFMENCPDLLLYGALVEAEPYLMNDARLAVWANMFQRSLDSLSTSDDRGEHSGSPVAMKLARR